MLGGRLPDSMEAHIVDVPADHTWQLISGCAVACMQQSRRLLGSAAKQVLQVCLQVT